MLFCPSLPKELAGNACFIVSLGIVVIYKLFIETGTACAI